MEEADVLTNHGQASFASIVLKSSLLSVDRLGKVCEDCAQVHILLSTFFSWTYLAERTISKAQQPGRNPHCTGVKQGFFTADQTVQDDSSQDLTSNRKK